MRFFWVGEDVEALSLGSRDRRKCLQDPSEVGQREASMAELIGFADVGARFERLT